MIIERSTRWTQVLIALLKDDQRQGIQSFGTSVAIITYLKDHPNRDFYLEASLIGKVLTDQQRLSSSLETSDIYTGRVRFDAHQNTMVCDDPGTTSPSRGTHD